MKVLVAPTGLHDIEYDESTLKEEHIEKGFYEVEVSIAPIRTHLINQYKQVQRKQHALRHRFTSTIHVAMGDTLNKVAMQTADEIFELWDKAQIIVALTRAKVGKNVILVGNKNEIIDIVINLV